MEMIEIMLRRLDRSQYINVLLEIVQQQQQKKHTQIKKTTTR